MELPSVQHPPPAVDVVVLAYGMEPLLNSCVSAVLASEDVDVAVYVVDNGASEAVRLLPEDRRLTVLTPGTNTGFARGCLIGAGAGSAENLVFVNSDAVVAPGAIRSLCRALDDETIGLVTGCVLLPAPRQARAAAPGRDALRVNAAGNPVHWLGFSWCGGYGRPQSEFRTRRDVASISGALFAIRRRYWRLLGGFDPMYFAYHEDVDLSLRTWCHGFRVVYEPGAVCVHHYEFSRHPRKTYLLERNRLITWLTVPSRDTLRRLFLPLVVTQCLLLGHALTHKGGRQWLAAWWWLLRHPAAVVRRRRRVQANRRVGDADWIALSAAALEPPDPAGLRVPAVVNWFLRLGHRRLVRRAGLGSCQGSDPPAAGTPEPARNPT